MKVHKADLRLRNNAGLNIPVCKANAQLLDTQHNLEVTNENEKVTCKHCKRAWNKNYPWANPIK